MASKNARYPKGFRASLFILVTPLLGLLVAAVLSNIASGFFGIATKPLHWRCVAPGCYFSFSRELLLGALSLPTFPVRGLRVLRSMEEKAGRAEDNTADAARFCVSLPQLSPPFWAHLCRMYLF